MSSLVCPALRLDGLRRRKRIVVKRKKEQLKQIHVCARASVSILYYPIAYHIVPDAAFISYRYVILDNKETKSKVTRYIYLNTYIYIHIQVFFLLVFH